MDAVNLDEDPKTIPAGKFNSPIFTLLVGLTSQEFLVHESMLSKSPVLARMVAERRQEEQERKLDLPEDSVGEIEKILDFLYSKDFPLPDTQDLKVTSSELARMYSAAHKYELVSLKTLTLKKIEKAVNPVEHAEHFLNIARVLSSTMPADYAILHDFLKSALCKLLGRNQTFIMPMSLNAAVKSKVLEFIRQGGQLATDVFEAQCSLDALKAEEARRASAYYKREIEEQKKDAKEWEEQADNFEKELGRLQDHHDEDCQGSKDCEFAL